MKFRRKNGASHLQTKDERLKLDFYIFWGGEAAIIFLSSPIFRLSSFVYRLSSIVSRLSSFVYRLTTNH